MSSPSAIVRPLVLALLVALGVGLAWAALVGWSAAVVEQFARSDRLRKYVHVRIDGTPLVRTYLSDNYRYGDWTESTLDGEPVEIQAGQPSLSGARLRLPEPAHPWLFHPGWNRRIFSFSDGGHPPVFWYFLYDGKLGGRGYWVGYDSRTKALVGYIGARGFQQEKPAPPDCFPVDGRTMSSYWGAIASAGYSHGAYLPDYYSGISLGAVPKGRMAGWLIYLASAGRLVEIDLQKRTSRVVFEHDGMTSVDILEEATATADIEALRRPPPPQYLAVLADDDVLLLDSEGELRYTFAVPPGLGDRSFGFYLLNDETALVTSSWRRGGVDTTRLFWIDGQGRVTRREEVTYRYNGFAEGLGVQAAFFGLLSPAPIAILPATTLGMAIDVMIHEHKPGYLPALVSVLGRTWPSLLAVHALAAVLAWLTWRRQRQFAAARSWTWVIFVFLFGAPGYVGYVCSRAWPARPPCDSCAEPAPRDRESCFACGSGFPEPAPKGSEVFA